MLNEIIIVGKYHVSLSTKYSIEDLEKNWLKIQQNSSVSPFLTWDWVSTWITSYSPDLIVVTATFENQIVAIGLFTLSSECRHSFFYSKQLRLNQLGDQKKDQIWVEYNKILSETSHKKAVHTAIIQAILKSKINFHELVFSMTPQSTLDSIINTDIKYRIESHSPTYQINLTSFHNEKEKYLNSLSRNTRAQIRKSIKLYEAEYGEITLTPALSNADLKEYIRLTKEFHIQRWEDSGYKNPHFVKFHKNLIFNPKHKALTQILKISSNNTTIAVLYFFVHKKTAWFYLQGIDYSTVLNKKFKPGLIAHLYAINYFMDKGFISYDFMAGYSQYKAQLASKGLDLKTLIIRRPNIILSIEDFIRKLKNKISTHFKK